MTILLFAKIEIVLEYVKKGWDDHLVISFITFWGLLKYKYEIPLIDMESAGIKIRRIKKKGKKEKKVEEGKEKFNFSEILNRIKSSKKFYDSHKIIICKVKDYLKGRLILKEFKLDAVIGTGEAYYTGILNGIAWAVAGILTSYLSNNFKTLKKCVNIKSDFKEKKFDVDLFCIFSIKIVHIIVVGIKLLMNQLKGKSIKKRMIGGDVVG